MSRLAGLSGPRCTDTSRYEANALDLHCAFSSPTTRTIGVAMGRPPTVHGSDGPSGRAVAPVASKYPSRAASPPPNAAGFVHAATSVESDDSPKRVLAAGGAVTRNDE